VEKVQINAKERKHLSLAGLPLKCEEERRTEILVFELCYARYFGYDQKTGKPGGTFLGQLREIPCADQRLFEQSMFEGGMRLHRITKGKPKLPNYLCKAYHELFKVHRRAATHSARLTVVPRGNKKLIPKLDAAA
jgi:hypothetical protein